jgi:hypothetical protein
MKKQNGLLVFAAIVGAIMLPSNAFTKTAKDWRAQPRGAAEEPYRDRCQGDVVPCPPPPRLILVAENTVPTTIPAPPSSSLSQKEEQDCVAEWKADQQRIMARGVTEDSFVEQCLASNSVPGLPVPKATAVPAAPNK